MIWGKEEEGKKPFYGVRGQERLFCSFTQKQVYINID